MLKITLDWQYSDNYMYLCIKFRNPPFSWNPLPVSNPLKEKRLRAPLLPAVGLVFYPVSICILF